jgi:copper homeostasis protein
VTHATARPLLEIAAGSLASALAAQDGGADRVELCTNLDEGGTTPSHGTIAVARDRLRIPLYVLVRPRAGDFCYDAAEVEAMLRDVEQCASLGCDGVVVGALDSAGDVDASVCGALVAAAGRLGVTFHRAFDVARDQHRALDAIIALRCERVLTSGGESTALAGAERIAELVQHAGSRIAIMAGAGITPDNIRDVAERSGARELHASARAHRTWASAHRNDRLRALDPDRVETDQRVVREMVDALTSILGAGRDDPEHVT